MYFFPLPSQCDEDRDRDRRVLYRDIAIEDFAVTVSTHRPPRIHCLVPNYPHLGQVVIYVIYLSTDHLDHLVPHLRL